MARVMDKKLAEQVAALNSTVKFTCQISPVLNADGDQVLDRAGQPKSTKVCRAELYNKADGKQWIAAEGGDEEGALRKALSLAKTAPRPASTAQEVIAERDKLTEQLAALRAENERLRSGTVRISESGSQRKRVIPPPAEPPAAATEESEPEGPESSSDGRDELRSLLKSAGVKVDGRMGIETLRKLAAQNGLIPAGAA